MQTGNIPRKVIEPLSRRTASGIHVDTVQIFQNIQMVRDFKIRFFGFAKTLQFHVFAVVFAQRHVVGDNIGNGHHRLFERRIHFFRFFFNSNKPFCARFYLRFHFFRFVFFAFLHQHTHLFGKGIARSAQSVAFRNQRAATGIQCQRFVHKGQFRVLKFLFDVLFYQFRIGPNQIDVDHLQITPFTFVFPIIQLFFIKRN